MNPKTSFSMLLLISACALVFLLTGCAAPPPTPSPAQPKQEDRGISVVEKMRTQAVSRNVGRWAVVIGISEYKYNTRWDPVRGIPNLQYAHRDAQAFAQFLLSPEGGAFRPDRVRLLTDRNATVTEVRDAIGGFLAQSLEDDLVIIFFAGHGMPDPNNPDNLYLACYDTEPGKFYGTAFPMWGIDDALSRTIRSRRVFVLADACHSAGVGGTRGPVAERFNQYLEKLAGSREGVTKITASRADELSLEKDYLGGGHGVFTYYLLEGLGGRADANGDGFVTMAEAYDYLYDRVRSETRHSQRPWASGYVSADIPLGIVDTKVLRDIQMRAQEQVAVSTAASPVTYRPPPATVDLPEDSGVALKLAEARLAKDEARTARDMVEAVIGRNDDAKPDALALKIAILLKEGDLKGAEDTEDLLVIPYPKHPSALKGARQIYEHYLEKGKGKGPDEEIAVLNQYLKRHPGGLLEKEARDRLSSVQATVRTGYEKRFEESLVLAQGFIRQNRFDHSREELEQARGIAGEAFDRYGISLDVGRVSTLLGESATREKAHRSSQFEEKFALARARFQAGDHTGGYRLLDEARAYGDPGQLRQADDLARQHNAPPDIKIVAPAEVDWDSPVGFSYEAKDQEGDPVQVVSWDFGDGKTSREDRPQHAYAQWSGTDTQRRYTVTLKATDGHSTVTATRVVLVKKQDCVARDGRFCKLGNGMVLDTERNLMWAPEDNGRDITWSDAKRYCETYRGGGYTDWRMPTQDELAGLYDKSKGYRTSQASYDAHLTNLIRLSTPWIWGSETRGSEAAFFLFSSALGTGSSSPTPATTGLFRCVPAIEHWVI